MFSSIVDVFESLISTKNYFLSRLSGKTDYNCSFVFRIVKILLNLLAKAGKKGARKFEKDTRLKFNYE